MKKLQICSICNNAYEGYGNNAEPINSGRCCDKCNMQVVLPKRIEQFRKSNKETK